MIALLVLAVALAEPLATYDLEEDDGNFLASGDLGQWRWGLVRHGPGAGWDGAAGWSTGLDADYLNDAVEYLEIPLPSLATADYPAMAFRHWHELGQGDLAWVEVDAGNGFVLAEPIFGYPVAGGFAGDSGGWARVVVPLPAGLEDARVRLVFAADEAYAGAGWTVDDVEIHDGDVAAPRLDALTELPDTQDLDGPYVVTVSAEDDVAVAGVTLWWSARGIEAETAVPMTALGDGTWRGEIPGQDPGVEVRYRVLGTDGTNETALPSVGTVGFRVYLPAPLALVGPEGRVVDTEATLTWSPPDTTHEVLGYTLYRGAMPLGETDGLQVEVPLLGGYDIFSVRARYAAGEGDASNVVGVDAVVPALTGLTPAEAWPGETLRLTATGASLLLVDGDVAATLGDGVTVTDVDVQDVDSAVITVEVAEGASAGARDLVLTTAAWSLREEGAFVVLDADGRPRLLSADPDVVRQGDRGVLRLRYVGDLAATPDVDLGDGLVVEGVAVDDDVVTVEYAVAPDARLGERSLHLDDGVRRLDGATVTVEDFNPAPARTCGPPLAAGLFGVGVATGLALGRRRPG